MIPRLGSNFDHEIVSTARAIQRLLKSQKLDWHDVAAAVTALAPPTQWDYEPHRTESGEARQMRAWLTAISCEDWLNAWTAGFVSDLCAGYSASPGSRRSRRSEGGMIDFHAVNRAAIPALSAIVSRLLPGGKIHFREYVVRNPRRFDRHPGSFRINLTTGQWADFATTDRGGDPISLIAWLEGVSQPEAAKLLARMLSIDAERVDE